MQHSSPREQKEGFTIYTTLMPSFLKPETQSEHRATTAVTVRVDAQWDRALPATMDATEKEELLKQVIQHICSREYRTATKNELSALAQERLPQAWEKMSEATRKALTRLQWEKVSAATRMELSALAQEKLAAQAWEALSEQERESLPRRAWMQLSIQDWTKLSAAAVQELTEHSWKTLTRADERALSDQALKELAGEERMALQVYQDLYLSRVAVVGDRIVGWFANTRLSEDDHYPLLRFELPLNAMDNTEFAQPTEEVERRKRNASFWLLFAEKDARARKNINNEADQALVRALHGLEVRVDPLWDENLPPSISPQDKASLLSQQAELVCQRSPGASIIYLSRITRTPDGQYKSWYCEVPEKPGESLFLKSTTAQGGPSKTIRLAQKQLDRVKDAAFLREPRVQDLNAQVQKKIRGEITILLDPQWAATLPADLAMTKDVQVGILNKLIRKACQQEVGAATSTIYVSSVSFSNGQYKLWYSDISAGQNIPALKTTTLHNDEPTPAGPKLESKKEAETPTTRTSIADEALRRDKRIATLNQEVREQICNSISARVDPLWAANLPLMEERDKIVLLNKLVHFARHQNPRATAFYVSRVFYNRLTNQYQLWHGDISAGLGKSPKPIEAALVPAKQLETVKLEQKTQAVPADRKAEPFGLSLEFFASKQATIPHAAQVLVNLDRAPAGEDLSAIAELNRQAQGKIDLLLEAIKPVTFIVNPQWGDKLMHLADPEERRRLLENLLYKLSIENDKLGEKARAGTLYISRIVFDRDQYKIWYCTPEAKAEGGLPVELGRLAVTLSAPVKELDPRRQDGPFFYHALSNRDQTNDFFLKGGDKEFDRRAEDAIAREMEAKASEELKFDLNQPQVKAIDSRGQLIHLSGEFTNARAAVSALRFGTKGPSVSDMRTSKRRAIQKEEVELKDDPQLLATISALHQDKLASELALQLDELQEEIGGLFNQAFTEDSKLEELASQQRADIAAQAAAHPAADQINVEALLSTSLKRALEQFIPEFIAEIKAMKPETPEAKKQDLGKTLLGWLARPKKDAPPDATTALKERQSQAFKEFVALFEEIAPIIGFNKNMNFHDLAEEEVRSIVRMLPARMDALKLNLPQLQKIIDLILRRAPSSSQNVVHKLACRLGELLKEYLEMIAMQGGCFDYRGLLTQELRPNLPKMRQVHQENLSQTAERASQALMATIESKAAARNQELEAKLNQYREKIVILNDTRILIKAQSEIQNDLDLLGLTLKTPIDKLMQYFKIAEGESLQQIEAKIRKKAKIKENESPQEKAAREKRETPKDKEHREKMEAAGQLLLGLLAIQKQLTAQGLDDPTDNPGRLSASEQHAKLVALKIGAAHSIEGLFKKADRAMKGQASEEVSNTAALAQASMKRGTYATLVKSAKTISVKVIVDNFLRPPDKGGGIRGGVVIVKDVLVRLLPKLPKVINVQVGLDLWQRKIAPAEAKAGAPEPEAKPTLVLSPTSPKAGAGAAPPPQARSPRGAPSTDSGTDSPSGSRTPTPADLKASSPPSRTPSPAAGAGQSPPPAQPPKPATPTSVGEPGQPSQPSQIRKPGGP